MQAMNHTLNNNTITHLSCLLTLKDKNLCLNNLGEISWRASLHLPHALNQKTLISQAYFYDVVKFNIYQEERSCKDWTPNQLILQALIPYYKRGRDEFSSDSQSSGCYKKISNDNRHRKIDFLSKKSQRDIKKCVRVRARVCVCVRSCVLVQFILFSIQFRFHHRSKPIIIKCSTYLFLSLWPQ